ncbi:ATP-binding protein [Mycetohabitans endofungorum]|uniref:ATP-binding protein n=1 Tax=Mycetohabitans endofungorum TaxID=417203 RepID=UPI0030D37420
MMMHHTVAHLRSLKLDGLAGALEEQLTQPGLANLSFEERLTMLVDREVHHRNERKLTRLLKNARLKYGQATLEDLDSRASRGIERSQIMSLALGEWVSAGHCILITGPTGVGKSWLACALAQYACWRGHCALYQRVPRLPEELRIRHGSGAFGKWLIQLAKTDVLILDLCAAYGYVTRSCSETTWPRLNPPGLHITGQSLRSQPTRSVPFKINAPPRGGARISGNTWASA